MNYIDRLADAIREESPPCDGPPDDMRRLFRQYALLALTTGAETTAENVHDAWSAWQVETRPDHRSLVPFAELSPDVQALDEPFVAAIRRVAAAESRCRARERVATTKIVYSAPMRSDLAEELGWEGENR